MNPRFKVTPLGALLDQSPQNGYSPVCPDTPTGKWVLSLAALDGYGFNPRGLKPAPMDDPLVDKFLLKPGDFLISRSNTADKVGRVGVFRGEIEQCSYPDLMMRFRPNQNLVDPGYLELYLKSEAVVSYIQKHATGTSGSMKKINQATVESIPIVLPSLQEQKIIAVVVSDWYAAVAKTEQLIEVKERRLEWLHEFLINKFSKDARHIYLKEVTRIPERTPVASTENETALTVKLYCRGIVKAERQAKITEKGRAYYRRFSGELLVGRQNIHNGGFGIVPEELNGAIASNAISSLVATTESVDLEYIFYFLSRPSYYARLEKLMGGTGQKEMSEAQLMKLPISLPSLQTQRFIVSILKESQKEILLLKEELLLIRRQKRGLMQKLLTGEGRVPVHEEATA